MPKDKSVAPERVDMDESDDQPLYSTYGGVEQTPRSKSRPYGRMSMISAQSSPWQSTESGTFGSFEKSSKSKFSFSESTEPSDPASQAAIQKRLVDVSCELKKLHLRLFSRKWSPSSIILRSRQHYGLVRYLQKVELAGYSVSPD